jgi:hypothetical protein
MSIKAAALLTIASAAGIGCIVTRFLLPFLGADRPLAIGCPFALAVAGIVCLVLAISEIAQDA